MIQRLTRTQWVLDALLAAGAVLVAWPFASVTMSGSQREPIGYLLLALCAAAVVLRRASPALALSISSASAIVQMAAIIIPSTLNVGQLLVVYACAAHGSRLMRRLSLGASVLGAAVATVFLRQVSLMAGPSGLAVGWRWFLIVGGVILVILISSWVLGLARHLSLRARSAAVGQRVAEALAQSDRERVAVELERGRVAREMHDVLAHSLVTIAMLADGARLSVRSDPDEAEDLTRTIGDVARESVTDVRRLLSELRHGQDTGAAPTFSELPSLIGRFESLGLEVDRRDHGQARPLTAGASLAAYRIVTESLTNALRHGDVSRPVVLAFTWSDGALRIMVRNRIGAGEESTPGGHGLVGIRERALLEAGTCDIRREDGDFIVSVSLPAGATVDADLAEAEPVETTDAPADRTPDEAPADHAPEDDTHDR